MTKEQVAAATDFILHGPDEEEYMDAPKFIPEQLAEAFPECFRYDPEVTHPEWDTVDPACLRYYDPTSRTWPEVWRITARNRFRDALLHAALRDLCERAGLVLAYNVGPDGDDWLWCVCRRAPYGPVIAANDTPAEAVLAAKDEINRRLP